MIQWTAEVVTNWLLKCGAISKEDEELYIYALYSTLLTCSPLILAILFGIVLGKMVQSILIILPFMSIRKFSGGYHSNSPGVCLISSSLILLLCIILSCHVRFGWLLGCCTILSAISLSIFSPIDNINRKLDDDEKIHCRKKTVYFVTIYLVIEVLLLLMNLYTSAICISIGTILTASLQLPNILKTIIGKLTK